MPTSQATKPIRVIVRLPYNRPDDVSDPVKVEWDSEKESILWDVIAKSRSSDSGGTDWQGLSNHLKVPLPYLLYRARVRYEEDIRGLQDLNEIFSPMVMHRQISSTNEDRSLRDNADMHKKFSERTISTNSKINTNLGIATSPLTIRARLSSLGSPIRPSRTSRSSILTLQGYKANNLPVKASSVLDSESESDSEENADEVHHEEGEALQKRLQELQRLMNSETLGLVRQNDDVKSKFPERGRHDTVSLLPRQSFQKRDSISNNGSLSTTTSLQGSIPSIPSPPLDSMSHSPVCRHLSPAKKSSSPPAISTGNARGQSHMQYKHSFGLSKASARSSTQGSSASSFSDIGDSNISASALESALLSNIRGGGSRLSAYARSQFKRKDSSVTQQ